MVSPLNRYIQFTILVSAAAFATLMLATFLNAAETGTGKQERKSSVQAIDALKQKLEQSRAELAEAEKQVSAVRRELRIVELPPDQQADAVRRIEMDRITAAALAVHYETILQKLSGRPKAELREILPTVQPDTNLSELLSRLSKAASDLSERSATLGVSNAQFIAIQKRVTNLESQVDKRVSGIMEGLSTLAEAQRAREAELKKQIERFQIDHSEAMERNRPYFAAKREYETKLRIFEAIQLRLLQEQVDAAIAQPEETPRR